MSAANLMLAAFAVPLFAALLIPLFARLPNIREAVTLVAAGLLLVCVVQLVPAILAGERPEHTFFEIIPGLSLGFELEPLGMLFALVASTLWIVNSIYSIGYMRGNDEPRQTQFYVCFAVAIASTIGLAFSSNLFSLFIFYEILTLSTYPLVTHKANDEARAGGRTYLLLLIGTSMVLLLPAILVTFSATGTTEFTPGGILGGTLSPVALGVLLAGFAFGIGKAALMPVHFWLPAAMVAPTPVSALLHAVAVVKAGVFSIVKILIYIFGLETLQSAGSGGWLPWVAAFTILIASVVALNQDNLKKRLAYSTVSQLSYVVLAAALLAPISVIAAIMHIAAHAVSKITLFFAAGSIYTAAHKTEISELRGIGRRMPWTMTAFTIGALSMIGLPPTAGFVSKWFMLNGAMDAQQWLAVVTLIASTVLNAAYFLPIVYTAFFHSEGHGAEGAAALSAGVPDGHDHDHGEAPWPIVLALTITATLTVALFLFPQLALNLAEAALEVPK